MQNHYNLVYREEEREMLPLCLDQGVGVIPWSPLARGLLTRDAGTSTERAETDEFGKTLYRDADVGVIEAVAAIAADRGVPRAQIALAWVSKHPAVTAPDRRGDEAAASRRRDRRRSTSSSPPTRSPSLESPYTPQPVQGFI